MPAPGRSLDGHVTVIYENVADWQYLLQKKHQARSSNATRTNTGTTSVSALFQDKVVDYLDVTERIMKLEDACLADPNRFEVLVIERSPLDVLEIFVRSNRDAYSEAECDALVGCCRMLTNSDAWSRGVRHILLDVDVATCMERIRRRGRGGEDLIDAGYMHTLDAAYRDLARTTPGITVLPIQADADRVSVVGRVLDVIGSEIRK